MRFARCVAERPFAAGGRAAPGEEIELGRKLESSRFTCLQGHQSLHGKMEIQTKLQGNEMAISEGTKAHFDAMDAATDYLRRAIKEIDAKFGEGYAKQHPELVATFMRVCAQEFAAMA